MASIDVRKGSSEEIDSIIFSDSYDGDTLVAHSIRQEDVHFDAGEQKSIRICDNVAYVIIKDADHARHLIRALEKSIDLGWIE